MASSTNSSTNSWYTTSLHRQFISTFSMLFYAEMFIKIKTLVYLTTLEMTGHDSKVCW